MLSGTSEYLGQTDLMISAFHRAQTLDFKNGYALPLRPAIGTGQDPLLLVNITHSTDTHRPPPLDFTPAHAAYNKKVTKPF
uniref:Uncharacterized protein n=1 Tax=Cyprinus carpio carpio TaxID=630221 RepID=A0A9J8D8V6_CYPCA